MLVRFWGVRGSIPSPGPNTVRFGGNTSCVEVNVEDEILIFDGGSGLRLLGKDFFRRGLQPVIASLFFSHTHWDHIQGFPFFPQVFIEGNVFKLYGPKNVNPSLGQTMEGQMEGPNFPVMLKECPAKIEFRDLAVDETLTIDLCPNKKTRSLNVSWARLHHPGGVYAYRLAYRNRAVVYATDTEHTPGTIDQMLVALAKDADVLIYDSQYTPEEFEKHRGWGHSTFEQGARVAKAAGVKKLVLFHHDPDRTDDQVLEIESRARLLLPGSLAAYEGLTLEV
ncbi:MAG: MBL fold metallo-hydrolase [Candidatus Riflebacteria bacterium]|nr:MBL fold metallo-hydrolase [Candidatus Riflebacteria bacterium]